MTQQTTTGGAASPSDGGAAPMDSSCCGPWVTAAWRRCILARETSLDVLVALKFIATNFSDPNAREAAAARGASHRPSAAPPTSSRFIASARV